MKCLRLIIHQPTANYRREDTMTNKMTYPLPPLSTIIGAIHATCKWKEYHEMDIAVLGNYDSINLRPYTNVIQMDSTADDRGKLVKFPSDNIQSNSYILIASSKKQRSSFKKKTDIDIHNAAMLDEYLDIKNKNDTILLQRKNELDKLKESKKEKNNLLSSLEKNSDEYKKIKNDISILKQQENEIKKRYEVLISEVTDKLQYYKVINTSLQYYEVLSNVNLYIYIRTSDENMNEIMNNIYNFKCIGRSEDIIDDLKCDIVEVSEIDQSIKCNKEYNSYIDYNLLKNGIIEPLSRQKNSETDSITCSIYYLNKNYVIEDDTRIFEKKKACYINGYSCAEENPNVFYDIYNGKKILINFL